MSVRQPKPEKGIFERILRGEAGCGVVGLAILGSGLLHGLGLFLVGQLERGISSAKRGAQVEFDVVEFIDGAGRTSRELASLEAKRARARVEREDATRRTEQSAAGDVKHRTEQRAAEDAGERDLDIASGESAGPGGQKRSESTDRRSGSSFTVPSGPAKVKKPEMVGSGKRGSSSLLTMRGLSSVRRDRVGGLAIRDQAALTSAIDKPRRGSIELRKPGKGKARRGPGRRIGEYMFYPEADGRLTYRDPQKNYLAVLMPNGDIEFETRAPVLGGVCALGVCVHAGGLRSQSKRKRKHLNRVRIRFAPVPVGVVGNFGSLRGIDDRKLQLMRATFQARLEMRVHQAQRLLSKALRGIHGELEHILATQTSAQARRLIIARALELDGRAQGFGRSDDRTKKLLGPLFEQKRAGARAMCQKILAFVQGHVGPGKGAVFTRRDVTDLARHCRSLAS